MINGFEISVCYSFRFVRLIKVHAFTIHMGFFLYTRLQLCDTRKKQVAQKVSFEFFVAIL